MIEFGAGTGLGNRRDLLSSTADTLDVVLVVVVVAVVAVSRTLLPISYCRSFYPMSCVTDNFNCAFPPVLRPAVVWRQ